MTLYGFKHGDDYKKFDENTRHEQGDRVILVNYPHSPYCCNRKGTIVKCDHPFYELELDPPQQHPNDYRTVRTNIYNLRPIVADDEE